MNKVPNVPDRKISVAGMFMGVYVDDNSPVLFALEGVEFLPIFSTSVKFHAAMGRAALRCPAKIQQITDHAEFIDSVRGKVRLMLDPWTTDHGTTRFTELLAEG